MAQIGSYVPAASMQLGMLDGVFTRMGGMNLAALFLGAPQDLMTFRWHSFRRTGSRQIDVHGRAAGDE